jgi:uncharacterized coiled-coil DUF342 family protein
MRLLQQNAEARAQAESAQLRCTELAEEADQAHTQCSEAIARISALYTERLQALEALTAAESSVTLLQSELSGQRELVATLQASASVLPQAPGLEADSDAKVVELNARCQQLQAERDDLSARLDSGLGAAAAEVTAQVLYSVSS